MITHEIMTKLIERKIVKVGTEVDATYRGLYIGGTENVLIKGTFLILAIHDMDGSFEFSVGSTVDGSRRRIKASAVFNIDGMDIQRLSETFGLIARSKQRGRGRKPKGEIEAA